MLSELLYVYRVEGLSGIGHRISRKLFKAKIKNFEKLKKLFEGKTGLEIGGPSTIFKKGGIFPLYPLLANLDGCNFSSSTIWEGNITEGSTYNYDQNNKGYQFITEATDLSQVHSDSYDVLLSCHSLEHIANPIKALTEWLRVLRKGGVIVLILPDPEFTFDHRRPISTLAHLIEDYKNNIDEGDLTCAEEVISLHDLNRDPFSKNKNGLPREWVLNNFEHRCLHHHVFSVDLLKELFTYLDIEIIKADNEKPFHLIAVGKKK